MKSLILLFSLTWCTQVFAQKELKVEFPDTLYTTPKSGSMIMPMYEYTGDTIVRGEGKYVIKLPSNLKNANTSWGFEFFTGVKDAKIERRVLIIVAEYKGSHPRIFVDYNGNLDITDDGPPLTPDTANHTLIYLHNSEVPESRFGLEIYPAKYYTEKSRKDTEKHYTSSSDAKKNKILPTDYWFSVRRLDWRIAEITIGKKAVKIGLYDGDCDGLLRLNARDEIIACENGENVSSRLSHGAARLSDTTLIRAGGQVYEVTRIDSLGRFIYLKPSKLKIDRIGPGDSIPDFVFLNTDSTTTSLYQKLAPKKYNLIYLWGSWCDPCTSTLPLLQEIAEAHADKLNVVAFNTADRPETIRKYNALHHVSWYTGMATNEIVNKLMVDAWPYYALIDENKKIVRLYISLDEVKEALKN